MAGMLWALTLLPLMILTDDGVLAQRFGRPHQQHPDYLYPSYPQGQQGRGQVLPGTRPGPGGFGRSPSNGEADEVLGSPCEYDEHCYSIEHTFCLNHKSCECKRGFVASPAGDRCFATVGVSCSTMYDCSGLGQGGECQQGVCDCGGQFVPAPDGSCIRGALRMEDACEEDLQCQTLGDGAVCTTGKCQCRTGMHAINDRCIASRALHEPCTEPSECFLGPDFQAIVTCHKGTGTCRCAEHYKDDGLGKCTSGSNNRSAGILMTFMLAISLFISSSESVRVRHSVLKL